jgi:hypothetical protein
VAEEYLASSTYRGEDVSALGACVRRQDVPVMVFDCMRSIKSPICSIAMGLVLKGMSRLASCPSSSCVILIPASLE